MSEMEWRTPRVSTRAWLCLCVRGYNESTLNIIINSPWAASSRATPVTAGASVTVRTPGDDTERERGGRHPVSRQRDGLPHTHRWHGCALTTTACCACASVCVWNLSSPTFLLRWHATVWQHGRRGREDGRSGWKRVHSSNLIGDFQKASV